MSTATSTSPASNLEYYRKQAKSLVRSVRSADSDAIARVRQLIPPHSQDKPFLLSDAQWVVAREHGFQSWGAFKRHVEEQGQGQEQQMGIAKTPTPDIKSNAVEAKTGKSWEGWFALLDSNGCQAMNHKEIVAVVREHGAGSWWQQMVTVEYEKARGLRVKNQSCDGDFQVNVSKTIAAPAEAVFYAWADPEKRAMWLPGVELTIRKATCPKSLRITPPEGSLDVMIYPKGEGKCSCTADTKKLAGPDRIEPVRAYWSAALQRLKEFVEV